MDKVAEWDEFADEYAAIQAESRLPIEKDVADWVAKKLPLDQMNTLDLAAGSGRYAQSLAPLVKTLTLNDWSKRMLQNAKRLLIEETKNAQYIVADWRTLNSPYDFVFVSQLPELTTDDVERMLPLARRALLFNLQTKQENELTRAIKEELKLAPLHNPQADPKRVTAVLQAPGIANHRLEQTHFDYTLKSETTVAEELEKFPHSLSLSSAEALSKKLTGVSSLQQVLPVTEHFRFDLLLSYRETDVWVG